MRAGIQARKQKKVAGVGLWIIVGICCLLPMGWMIAQVVMHPSAMGELKLDSYRVGLIWRTLFYNLSAAVIATVLAVPAAMVLGRGRGWVVKLLWVVLPVSLLFP
jgi:ABC-type Fe3+ transport system permease subunit